MSDTCDARPEGIYRAPCSSTPGGQTLSGGITDPDPLLRRLLGALGPDRVESDETTRHTYAMDASPCYVPPRAVVRPRSEAEVLRSLETCRDLRVPITARAGGTSLSGAAIGPGVVLDTIRMTEIRDFDGDEGWVCVEPGVQLLELNAWLGERGFFFPPDPGSQEWCRIGGMVGHNASGYRSVKYGQTKDYVLRLRVALADGAVIEACDTPVGGTEWSALTSRVPALERIRRAIADEREAILAARRPVKKHSCGYDVFTVSAALDRGIFPVAALFLGSEGTLGVVTEVTLRVLPVPARRITLLMYLDRFEELGPLVRDLLPLRPSTMEAIDGGSLDLVGREGLAVPSSARAMLLVEFDEGDLEAMAARVVERIGPHYALTRPVEVAVEPSRQDALWKARRSLFPSLLKRPGGRKPWGFVEDPIVPTDRVSEFIAFLAALARRHGTVAGIYGHIGDGNTHYRPLFDPLDPEDFARMQALREEFDEALLVRFRGAPSAEHGVGRIRQEVLPRTWGPRVYALMRTIKDELDPQGILNPGVLLGSMPWWETWAGLETRTPQ